MIFSCRRIVYAREVDTASSWRSARLLDVINRRPRLGTSRAPAPNPGRRAGVQLEDLGKRHHQCSDTISDKVGVMELAVQSVESGVTTLRAEG